MPPEGLQHIVFNTSVWYSHGNGSSSHTHIKEKLMPEPRTCHLTNSTALVCIDIVVPNFTKRGVDYE
jgi:hypothetical protein